MKTVFRNIIISVILLFLAAGALSAVELRKEFNMTFDIDADALLRIENYRGAITIRSEDRQTVAVHALIKVIHYNDDTAKELLDTSEIVVNDSSAKKLDIETRVDRNLLNEISNMQGFWKSLFSATDRTFGPVLEITFDVTLPRTINLDVKTERGPLDIRGIQGDINAINHRGSVTIDNITGLVFAETERADMELVNITGAIKARNHRGEVRIHSASGDVNAATERANLTLEAIQGNVLAHNHRGEITAINVAGFIKAETERADIILHGISKDIEAINGRGSITIKDAHGGVTARTERADINAEIVEIENNSRIEFENERGQVHIMLPENINADVSISVERGEIQSDFPLKIQGTISQSSIEGIINDGGIPLFIRNSRGSITLKKK